MKMNEKQKPEVIETPKKNNKAAIAALALTAAAGLVYGANQFTEHREDKVVTDQEIFKDLEELSAEGLVENEATFSKGPIIEGNIYGKGEQKVGTLIVHYNQQDGPMASEVRSNNNRSQSFDWRTTLNVRHELAQEHREPIKLAGKIFPQNGHNFNNPRMNNGPAELVIPLNPEFSGNRTVIVGSLTEMVGHNLSIENHLPQAMSEEKELARVTVNVDGTNVEIVPEKDND